MKKLLLGIMSVCLIATTPVFANGNGGIEKSEEKVEATNFSVKVNSGSAALAGANVKLIQGGDVIGSGTTDARGMVALSVPNQENVTIQITAKGHKANSKVDFIPADGEIIPIVLTKLVLKPSPMKPMKK
jgi:lipopolysaccharide export system protein LptA